MRRAPAPRRFPRSLPLAALALGVLVLLPPASGKEGVGLELQEESPLAPTDASRTYGLRVWSALAETVRVDVEATFTSPGFWRVEPRHQSVTLPSGLEARFRVNLTAPSDRTPGAERADLLFVVRDANGTELARATTTAHRAAVEVRFEPESLVVAPGETATAQVTARNPTPRYVSLWTGVANLTRPDSTWTVEPSLDREPVFLPPGATWRRDIRFTADAGNPPGSYTTLTVSLGTPEGRVYGSASLTATAGDPLPPPAPAVEGTVPDPSAAAGESGGSGATVATAAVALGAVGTGAAVVGALRRREDLRYAALVPLAGLFTRLQRAEVAAHETRDRILALVRERPGITYSELRHELNVASGTLVHHLRTLERHRYLASRREGSARRFYDAGARIPAGPPPLSPVQERILSLLDEGPLAQRVLAQRLAMTKQGVNHHVRLLRRRGLLDYEVRDGEWLCVRRAGP